MDAGFEKGGLEGKDREAKTMAFICLHIASRVGTMMGEGGIEFHGQGAPL